MRCSRIILLAVMMCSVASMTFAGDKECCPDAPPLTICVPKEEKTTKSKAVYSSKCTTICIPVRGCCHRPDCGECGRPREVRKLMKRFVKQEVCETKCEPQVVSPENCPPAPAPATSAGPQLPEQKK